MLETLGIEDFLKLPGPLYDVRSPSEFIQGTIPGAWSLPLFSDEERKEVGIFYKKNPSAAFLLGLKFAGPKLTSLAEEGLKSKTAGRTRIFCFRGGQRSGSIAWLFRTAGVLATTLQGGYKAFRRLVFKTFSKTYTFKVIGGLSGSGKTALLHQLKQEGKQVIDLEALAGHKGSVFGHLGKATQPSNESFENSLAYSLMAMIAEEPIWIEDESRRIGSCKIPDPIYLQMKQASFHYLETPKVCRQERLILEYGNFPKEELVKAVFSLIKRLGEMRTREIINYIQENRLEEAVVLLLDYYDKAYLHSIHSRLIPT